MPIDPPRVVPHYFLFRLIFSGITALVWFLLFLAFGYLVVSQLPGTEPFSVRTAWRFFLVGFFPVLFFGGTASFIGFLRQHLLGAFISPPPQDVRRPPLLWHAAQANSPWLLGINRLLLLWPPAALFALLFLRLLFPNGIGRRAVVWLLAGLGAVLAGIVAVWSSGAPFHYETGITPEHRRWRGSFFSYLFWRHGVPWGIGNGLITALIALAIFPRAQGGESGAMPALTVSVDAFTTLLMLCFFMAVSAHPHAWVDTRLGVIAAPQDARSPTRTGRIFWFVGVSIVIVLAVLFSLTITGFTQLSLWEFVSWKGIGATIIAGAAAMVTAYWTMARENAPTTAR